MDESETSAELRWVEIGHTWELELASGAVRGPHDGWLPTYPVRTEEDRLLIGLPASD